MSETCSKERRAFPLVFSFAALLIFVPVDYLYLGWCRKLIYDYDVLAFVTIAYAFLVFIWHVVWFSLGFFRFREKAATLLSGSFYALIIEIVMALVITHLYHTEIERPGSGGSFSVIVSFFSRSVFLYFDLAISILFASAGLIFLSGVSPNRVCNSFGKAFFIVQVIIDLARFGFVIFVSSLFYRNSFWCPDHEIILYYSSPLLKISFYFLIWHIVCFLLCYFMDRIIAKALIFGSFIALIAELLFYLCFDSRMSYRWVSLIFISFDLLIMIWYVWGCMKFLRSKNTELPEKKPSVESITPKKLA